MQRNEPYREFYLRFSKLAAEAEIPQSLYKEELGQKITYQLHKGVARKAADYSVTFDKFQKTLDRLTFIKEAESVRITAAQGRTRQPIPCLTGKALTAGDGPNSSENTKEINKRTDTNKTARASHPGRP